MRFIKFSFFVCAILSMYLAGRAQKPEMVVQTGHSERVNSVAFSPDGKTLASGSFDHTVKLWDVASGTEMRAFKGHSDLVNLVAFSPDGKTLATGGYDSTIKLWDVASGSELRSLEGDYSIESVAFSPDGKTLASGSWDFTIKLWDVASGTELRSLKGHSDVVRSVAFGPDGKLLASGSQDNTIKLWEVATGTELRALKGHSDSVESVTFSPDGKLLASGSKDNTIKLWEVATGTEWRALKGHSYYVESVAFSPDGKTLASGSSDNTIKLWEVASGTQLRTLNGHSDWVDSVTFSPDGKTLASSGGDKTIKLWDLAGGTELRTLNGHSDRVNSIAISSDGKTLASGGGDKTIKLWDLASGTELRVLRGHAEWIRSVAFSPDSKTLASGSYDDTIKLWDVASGTELRSLKGHSDVESVAFSPDGKMLASTAGITIKLWEVASGTELRELQGHFYGIGPVAFSPDGKTLASGGKDNLVKLWDVASGSELREFKGDSYQVNSVAFSPDGKTLASGGADNTVKLWDAASGTELRTLKGHSNRVVTVAFSPDGKILASGSWDQMIKLWDVASGAELRSLNGHSSMVESVAFSPDGKTLASGSVDTSIKVWDVSSGKELASLIAVDENGWLVVTPDGLFDGSPAAWNQIRWRFNNNTFDHAPVEAFFSDFYYPGLLAEIFAGKRPKAMLDIAQKDRRQVPVILKSSEAIDSNEPIASRTLTLQVQVEEAPAGANVSDKSKQLPASGARDVRLFRNGSLVKIWPGDVFALSEKDGCKLLPQNTPPSTAAGPRRSICTVTIPIVAGPNNFRGYAFNNDNVKSEDATLTVTGADSLKRKGTAYIVAVGVNKYANAKYNLKYAVADAQDFASAVRAKQEALGQYERVDVVSLYDRAATKENILKALSGLAAKIQPEDAVIIYFAGHGVARGNRFYLVPHDLGYTGSRDKLDQAGLTSILAHGISDEELQTAVEGINAGQMLMVIDACNSGQALEAEEKRRGPMNSKGLAQLAYEKGMYILTAAQSYQAALEASKLGHGYLTYALVEEGLKTAAADTAPKDGSVLLREWLDYATTRVPAMQQEKLDQGVPAGAPATPEAKRLLLQQTVTFTNGEEQTDPAQRTLQRPRVFYRREVEPRPWVVAKP